MSKQASEQDQIQNEKVLRSLNGQASDAIKQYFSEGTATLNELPLDFNCECSKLNCGESVTMPIKQYEKLHERKDRFVLVKGHQSPQIEKVVENFGNYIVVEKFALSHK